MNSFYSPKLTQNSGFAINVRRALVIATVVFTGACGSDDPVGPEPATGFLAGTSDNREIGLLVNSGSKSLTMFQVGSPTTTVQIPLGSSTTISPVGYSIRGRKVAVPLGNAASVAIVDLQSATVGRHFTFSSGNATGSVWANDTTVFVANTNTDQVGRIYLNQTSSEITTTVPVAPAPTAMAYAAGRVFVVSGNLENYVPKGEGIVTVINPTTMAVLATIQTGGTNSYDAAVGPDGLLYVINTGDYVSPGNMAIINPETMTRVAVIPNLGVGPGQLTIDSGGLAYISSFVNSTLVWNTRTRTFVRGPENPVCATDANTGYCRGASSSAPGADGRLYQLFFGSASQGLAPYAFVYDANTFALRDSISVGSGPMAITIRKY